MKQGFGVEAVILKLGEEMHILLCPRLKSIRKLPILHVDFV